MSVQRGLSSAADSASLFGMGFAVRLRFYEELNVFLPEERRKRDFSRELNFSTSVKDLIESCGVPHTEVDLILVNGGPVDFNYRMQPEDRVSVYPVFESLDIEGVTRLQERPLRDPRFVADVHLGRLARNLRLLGFDVTWRNDANDRSLVDQVRREGRCLLTRDRRLLMSRHVDKGYCVRSDQHREQTAEVVRRFDLRSRIRPFTRCPRCNGLLLPVDKRQIEERLEPLTRLHHDVFVRCEVCEHIYWEGSHMRRLRELVEHCSG